MYHILFSLRNILDCFQFLAIMNKASMNIFEQVSLLYVGASFGYMPNSGIAGSQGRPIPNFLRNCQIGFQSGSSSLHSHQQWRSVPLAPYPHQHVLSLEFLILAILVGVSWTLRIILIYISLMTKDIEHFFNCFLAIKGSSVENSLFSFVLHCFFFLLVLVTL